MEKIDYKNKSEQKRVHRKITLAPSVARIFNMDKDTLLGHYMFIKIKSSSLSSAQRQLVIKRVEFLKMKGKITEEEYNKELIIE